MRDKTLKLAKAAGFLSWEDESWRPTDIDIDWGCEYDKELEEFQNLVVRECAYLVQAMVDQRIPASEYRDRLLQYWKN
jgi:hypothetical protein